MSSLHMLNLETGAQQRFIRAMEGFLSGVMRQVDAHASAKELDIETYMAIRRQTIGVFVILTFTE